MSRSSTTVLLIALLAAPMLVRAEGEVAENHTDRPQKVIALGETRIVPSKLAMSASDVLAFQNYSSKVLQVTFLEPPNVGQKVQCKQIQRVSATEAMTPGAVFKRRGEQVIALIAPNAFVSVCGLSPGRYVFSMAPFAPQIPDQLGQKGEIVVE
ncbi:MAG: hypothetical protein ACREQL_13375 [Candidatus Binatia bacterium]